MNWVLEHMGDPGETSGSNHFCVQVSTFQMELLLKYFGFLKCYTSCVVLIICNPR